MDPVVEITFDCLPLRSVARLDPPLDASADLQQRHATLVQALETYGRERVYYLYNARCVFRLANSEIEGMIRYEFDGIVRTDAGDALTEEVDLRVKCAGETCGGIPDGADAWLQQRVRRAVAIEFDRFIQAGQLAERTAALGQIERLSDVANISGMGV